MAPQAFVDEIAATFREAWPKLGCHPDDFIRTTEPRHKRGVQELWKTHRRRTATSTSGHYEGLYCVGCEAYYTEKDLQQPGNLCPHPQKPVECVKEESYFFRLSTLRRQAARLLRRATRASCSPRAASTR